MAWGAVSAALFLVSLALEGGRADWDGSGPRGQAAFGPPARLSGSCWDFNKTGSWAGAAASPLTEFDLRQVKHDF